MLSFVMFCLFLVTKQFYLFESGTFQLGDAFLALAVVSFGVWYLIKGRKEKRFWDVFWKWDLLLAVFVVCTIIINGIWFMKYRDMALIRSSMFLVYNLAAVIVCRSPALENIVLNTAGAEPLMIRTRWHFSC